MSGNTFGTLYSYTTFGESHGEGLGVVIDGFPAGITVDENFIQLEMDRRRPGSTSLGTKRNEADKIHILSGVFEGKSTGTPIAVVVYNENQNSKDYSNLAHLYRPGHADYTYDRKYGIRDYRGGGRSSGRETLARVIAGAFAKLALIREGIVIDAGVVEVGGIKATGYQWEPPFEGPLYVPSCSEKPEMEKLIEDVRMSGDSIGCVVECRVLGCPVGLGDPCFDKLDALLAHAIFSLGAVKGFEIGTGFEAAKMRGSQNNDQMHVDKSGFECFCSNNAGGILGGISNGNDIIFRAAFKPTPSISMEQHTITDNGKDTELQIKGRHDPIIGPRAVVVVEAMAATVILDCLMKARAAR